MIANVAYLGNESGGLVEDVRKAFESRSFPKKKKVSVEKKSHDIVDDKRNTHPLTSCSTQIFPTSHI